MPTDDHHHHHHDLSLIKQIDKTQPIITSTDDERAESLHRTVKMNLSELIIGDNVTFDETEQQRQQPDEIAIFYTMTKVFWYVSLTLGIPGNILSAIVWLRLHVAGKNSSAVYLAALAINDLVYLLNEFSSKMIGCVGLLCRYSRTFLFYSTTYIEPVHVLSFSVERLTAISCPLKVRARAAYIMFVYFRVNMQRM